MTEEALLELLHSMSLDEKVGQLCQIDMSTFLADAGSLTGPVAQFNLTREQLVCAGSLICGGGANAEQFAKVQQQILDETPHHIPSIIMSDVIHGMRTIFPIPLALGCTFDEDTAEEMARISAKEAASCGIHVTFAPMADVVRDPRWGRCMESVGEAPALCGALSAAMVRGFHGDGTTARDSLATCAKHFAAYGAVEAGRDYAPVDVSRTELYNVYLPPFKQALDAGCDMIMPAFTPIDRVPAVANPWLLKKVLRERWGWQGAVISDWGAAGELIAHGMARDLKDATMLSLRAGTDMDMMSFAYITALKQLVEEGSIQEQELDEPVMRILRMKNDLGLFDNPIRCFSEEEQRRICHLAEHRDAARKAAQKSCVLLKNESVLPLCSGMKIALAGEFADSHELLGSWSADGQASETPSILDVLKKDDRITLCAPEEADAIVFTAGETQQETGESTSKAYPFLPARQAEALEKLAQLGKPVVMVLFCGRPLILGKANDLCDAILNAWFPGSEGAAAIVSLLMGDANPSGHLAMTYPRALGQIPIHHDALTVGRPSPGPEAAYTSRYMDEVNAPLYPFGHGLSYTTFDITDVTASPVVSAAVPASIRARVRNSGDRFGETVVQVYARVRHAGTLLPQKTLVGWKRIGLNAGEQTEVSFDITLDQLCTYDAEGDVIIPSGAVDVALGETSAADFTASFSIT